MVDFNNDTTIGTPAVDIMRVLVIEERKYILDAIEDYNKRKYMGADPDNSVLRSRLYTLYYELLGSIHRHKTTEEAEELERQIRSDKYEDNLSAAKTLILLLDTFKLTRLDTKRVYDSTRPDVEDKEKKL